MKYGKWAGAFVVVLAVTTTAALLLGGCGGSSDGYGCTQDIVPGVVVTVTNAQTGANLAATTGLVATVTDNGDGTSEILRPYRMLSDGTVTALSGENERAGSYHVQVSLPGYAPYDRGNVTVSRGDCHVNTVTLAAALTPL